MPLYFLLIPFGIVLIAIGIFSIVNLYHYFRFSSVTLVSFLAGFGYVAGLALILFFTAALLVDVDWTIPIRFSLGPPII